MAWVKWPIKAACGSTIFGWPFYLHTDFPRLAAVLIVLKRMGPNKSTRDNLRSMELGGYKLVPNPKRQILETLSAIAASWSKASPSTIH